MGVCGCQTVSVREIKVDAKFGSLSKLSPSAAETHYHKMAKSGVGEEAKGVMFGLPPATTEKQIGVRISSQHLLLV